MQAYNVIYLKQYFPIYSGLNNIYLCGLKLCGTNPKFLCKPYRIIFCFFNTFIFYFVIHQAVKTFVMKTLEIIQVFILVTCLLNFLLCSTFSIKTSGRHLWGLVGMEVFKFTKLRMPDSSLSTS